MRPLPTWNGPRPASTLETPSAHEEPAPDAREYQKMDDIARAAEDLLLTHPHPALRLGELQELLEAAGARGLGRDRLRALLEARPDSFRILDAWRGRAKGVEDRPGPEPWVVCVSERRPPDGPAGGRTSARLREGVRWLARDTDPRSRLHVGRWYALALAEREARRVVARGSAAPGAPDGVERRAS